MIVVHKRVAKLVVFVRELDGRAFENDALLNSEALCKASSRNVADNNFKGNDGYLFDGVFSGRLALQQNVLVCLFP